jgi:hypothetical protein
MEQHDLFDAPHARNTDPDTSHQATRRLNIKAQAFQVLRVYAREDRPMIDHEAYALAGLARIGGGSRQRCSDLRDAGLIERLEAKGLTPSHEWAHLSRITPKGLAYLAAMGGIAH